MSSDRLHEVVVGAGPCQLARLAVRPETAAHLEQLHNTTGSLYAVGEIDNKVQPASLSAHAWFCWEDHSTDNSLRS